MKTKKKLLTGLLTLVMVLSLTCLPEGMVAEAADDGKQVDYCIYFDAENGKLYKEAGFDPSASDNPAESWVPALTEEYTGDASITCNGNELTLNNFYLFPQKVAIIIKGDAVIKLSGKNIIDKGNFATARCGIYAYDNLSITGTGSLSIEAFRYGIFVGKNLNIKDAVIDSQSSHYAFQVKGNFVMESGSVTGGIKSYYGDNNGGTTTHVTHGICVDGNLVVNGGLLTGNSDGGLPSYGVHAGGDITVNDGTLSGYATLVSAQGEAQARGYGIYAANKIIVNGGTMEGRAPNKDNLSYHSYGAYAKQGFVTGSNIDIVGGYRDYLHDYIELAADKMYFRDIVMDKECRYIRFTTLVLVSGIEITSPSNPNLEVGGSTALNATVVPADASNPKIKWESSDDTIASVDENGKVTAHKPGSVTITATAEDGGYKKEITITVSKKDGEAAPTGITAVAPTTEGGSDGKLIGVNSTMEYSTNADFTDAKPCTGNEVTGLLAGTYYVRVKETDSTKAGEAVAVVVPKASQKSIMEGLGVSEEVAKQILNETEKLGVSTDTLLITDASIKAQKSDADLKGSTFGMLKARTTNLKGNSVTIKWDKVKDADGYLLYGNKCGKKNPYKLIKTFTKNSTVKYTQKKLKKGTYYKYLVVAYKNIGGVKVTIAAAKTVHATTKGGKYGVAKSVKVNQTSKTLAVSKTFKIKASEVKQDKKIRRHRKIKYESDNEKIATVSGKGVVKAKEKGTCYIYVYAQNGVYKRIKITVK